MAVIWVEGEKPNMKLKEAIEVVLSLAEQHAESMERVGVPDESNYWYQAIGTVGMALTRGDFDKLEDK